MALCLYNLLTVCRLGILLSALINALECIQRRAACEAVLQGDFFLRNVCDEFMEGARLLIFETYCRIHNKLDISMLASKMGIQEVTNCSRFLYQFEKVHTTIYSFNFVLEDIFVITRQPPVKP